MQWLKWILFAVSFCTCHGELRTWGLGFGVLVRAVVYVGTVRGKRCCLLALRCISSQILLIEGDRLVSELLRSLVRMVSSASSASSAATIASSVSMSYVGARRCDRWGSWTIAGISVGYVRFTGRLSSLFLHARNVA
jgi:hypothetical protein